MPAPRPNANRKGQGRKTNRVQKFHHARLRDSEEPELHEEQSEDTIEVDEISESGSDDEQVQDARPYNVLLETFNINVDRTEHRRKRRKVSHADTNTSLEALSKKNDLEDDELPSSEIEQDVMNGEVEEDSDEELAGVDEDPDQETPGADYFKQHLEVDSDELQAKISSLSTNGWTPQKISLGKSGKAIRYTTGNSEVDKTTTLAPIRLSLKNRFNGSSGLINKLEQKEKQLAQHIFSYQDVLFAGRTVKNAADLRSLSALHALNHVFKTRDRVLKNNNTISSGKAIDGSAFRDQGFTRPKILYILPTRNSCAKVVKTILSICKPNQQENQKRFEDEYGKSEDQVQDDRPDDFKELFEGNEDDMFRVGLKFTRKTVKLFSQFYSSDIILGSPLGLRKAIESGSSKKKDSKKKDYDYLSSIEIVIIDQADALLMQNWEHVTYVMSHLNLSPMEPHGCDFSRVRMFYLDDNAKYVRQTILLSSFTTPEINSLFSKHQNNLAGKLKYQETYDGSMLSSGHRIKQSFSRFQSSLPQKEPEDRFAHFTSTIVPWILRLPRPADGAIGLLIFIPSYFDFVRLRNFLSTSPSASSIAFGTLSENNSPAEPEVRRARSHFISGRHSVLLYTGRAHHFYRYMVKGVKNVVVYQIPDNPLFYKEVVGGFVGNSITTGRISASESKVRVLFSRWDALRLERVVGTERVGSMLGAAGDSFDFI